MLRRNNRRRYEFHEIDGDEWGVYIPEQMIVVDETLPNFLGIHYQSPSLIISPNWLKDKRKRDALREFLLWLDEKLPDEPVQYKNIEALPDDTDLPDIWFAPHPDDYKRLKSGKKKRITESPEWQIYFEQD